MSARVIGIGQPAAGDDGVAWAVVEALRREPLPDGVALQCVREASALVPLLEGRVVLIDALLADPGDIHLLDEHELDSAAMCRLSSHGISVPEAIGLARALGQDSQLSIVGIGIAPPQPTPTLSPAVAAAVPAAVRAVLALLHTK